MGYDGAAHAAQGGTEAAALSVQCGAEAEVPSSQCGVEVPSSQCGAEVPSSQCGAEVPFSQCGAEAATPSSELRLVPQPHPHRIMGGGRQDQTRSAIFAVLDNWYPTAGCCNNRLIQPKQTAESLS